MLCTPIAANTTEKALQDAQEASQLADVIEIRLDYISHPDLKKLLAHRPKPIIATCRPTREGGRFEGPEEVRIKLLEQAVELGAEFVDIEHDSVGAENFQPLLQKGGKAKVIISYHNFKETPANLKEIYARLSDSPADIVKIVTTANDITDNLKIFHLLEAVGARCNVPLQGKWKPLSAFCMGKLGQISRILAPKYGSSLTFGSLATGKESAPGQLTAREMLEVYHINEINGETSIYGLIGNPVGHSLGPYIHNAAFRELGINAVYLPFKVEDLKKFVQGFKGLKVQGYSVTIPHKEAIVPLLDGLDPLAREIGAVNTVVNKAGNLMGYNTDSTAALRELEEAVGDLKGKKATLIGAGGAARAIAFGLKKKGADVTLVNRTEDRARRLAQELGCHYRRFEDVTRIDGEVLINTTSVGMYPKTDVSLVPPEALRPGMWVFDIVYNPLQTRLLREAGERGCRTLDGLRMFLYQAAQQFELWTGRPAPLELMERVIRERLGVRGQGTGVRDQG
ncbi:MAG TPA: shikimate dehydrogenase [Candidatus Tripitaka californicus]|uniref:shikimate dehydrogenase n=1 Tax=Candidatus Tripitaka californicus TaxID=3367616 RepID=UPI0040271322